MFLSLLLNKYTWIALILGGLVLTIGVERVEIRHKTSVIAEKDVTIGEMRASVAERDALIASQNRAVEGWKAAGIENAKRAALAQKRADALAATAANTPIPLAPTFDSKCSCSLPREKWLTDQLNSLVLH